MSTDLFEEEAAILKRATDVMSSGTDSSTLYRSALEELVQSYERLMRESRRLITRSDRTEKELNLLNTKLKKVTQELDHKAKHDNLTGVLNRGTVFDNARRYLKQSHLSLIILDIDLFKHINDEFGHPTGDAVIQEIVNRLKKGLRKEGDIGRVGGEEFMILFPALALEDAVIEAEALRAEVIKGVFPCLPSRLVTASFGVSWAPVRGSFDDVYARADVALYQAKHAGRNCVVAKAHSLVNSECSN